MAEKSKFEEMVAEKRAAGLSREQAEEAANRQIEWDKTDPHDEPPGEKKKAAKPEPKEPKEPK